MYNSYFLQPSKNLEQINIWDEDASHEINHLKAVLRHKFKIIRRAKNNRIGINKTLTVTVPISPNCFSKYFKGKIPSLSSWSGENLRCNLQIKELDPVLSVRWHIGQSESCSTQSRLIGDLLLRYRHTKIDVKQISFNG